MDKCSKCQKSIKQINMVIHSGDKYLLCDDCFDVYQKEPTGGESWVSRNIREAREKGEAGKGYWK